MPAIPRAQTVTQQFFSDFPCSVPSRAEAMKHRYCPLFLVLVNQTHAAVG